MRFVLSGLLACSWAWASKGVIVIDPGHPSEIGRGTAGKSITELKLCWEVGLKLRDLLHADGYTVYLTKQRIDQMVRNRDRAAVANRVKADLMIRLHADYAPGERGFATFVAQKQGRDGAKVGPSRAVLDSAQPMATAFHRAAMDVLKGDLPDRGLRGDHKTKVGSERGALIGSIHSEVPSILVEMVVLNDEKDDLFANSPNGQKLLAEALRQGVHAALKARPARKARA